MLLDERIYRSIYMLYIIYIEYINAIRMNRYYMHACDLALCPFYSVVHQRILVQASFSLVVPVS